MKTPYSQGHTHIYSGTASTPYKNVIPWNADCSASMSCLLSEVYLTLTFSIAFTCCGAACRAHGKRPANADRTEWRQRRKNAKGFRRWTLKKSGHAQNTLVPNATYYHGGCGTQYSIIATSQENTRHEAETEDSRNHFRCCFTHPPTITTFFFFKTCCLLSRLPSGNEQGGNILSRSIL